jgi:hypothetical protein
MTHIPRSLSAAMLVLTSLAVAAVAQQEPTQHPRDQSSPSPAPGTVPQDASPSLKPPARTVDPSETPAGQSRTESLVGLVVFSSDGTRVGEVRSVSTGPGGDIVTLNVRTGGFLGFGGRIVAIPGGKFIRSGHSIRLDLDSEAVTALPDVKG